MKIAILISALYKFIIIINQGRDDKYIRLRSHGISHPVVSRLRQSHLNAIVTIVQSLGY